MHCRKLADVSDKARDHEARLRRASLAQSITGRFTPIRSKIDARRNAQIVKFPTLAGALDAIRLNGYAWRKTIFLGFIAFSLMFNDFLDYYG